MDPKPGKEQDAKANSLPSMTTPDDSYDPFMVSMCYLLRMGMVCRLCATSEELCRSHIQPKFHYQPLYDEKNWFSILIKGIKGKSYGQHGLSENSSVAHMNSTLANMGSARPRL